MATGIDPFINFDFYYYGVAFLSLFGVVGNIFSVVLIRKTEKDVAWSPILVGLLICDTVVLICYILNALLFYLYDASVIDGEQLLLYLGLPILPVNKTAYVASVYAIVILAIEQYYSVLWPLHPEKWLTKRAAVYALGLAFQFAICLNVPRWLELNMGYDSEIYILFYHGWIWLLTSVVIPVIVITILTWRIWRKVPITGSSPQGIIPGGRPDTALTKTLLILALVFIVANCLYGLSILHFTILKSRVPILAELYSSGPLALNAAIKSVIFCMSVRAVKEEFQDWMGGWNFRRNTHSPARLLDPADCNKTILDTRNIQLVSYKFHANV